MDCSIFLSEGFGKMAEAIVGGLFALLAAGFGAWLTFIFVVKWERRKKKEELLSLLKMVIREIELQVDKLSPAVGSSPLLGLSAYELLKIKGLLGDLPEDVSKHLMEIYDSFYRVNDFINESREASGAALASGNPDFLKKVPEYSQTIELHRKKALEKVTGCIEILKSFLKKLESEL